MRGRSIHIGVDRVDPAGYPKPPAPLRTAERDAAQMHLLARRQRFTATMLLGSAATRAAVMGAFADAAKELRAGDLCVITFAGHGGRLQEVIGEDATGRPAGATEQLTADADDGDDEYWGLSDGVLVDDHIARLLAAFEAGVRVYVLSDSCYSGTILRGLGTPVPGVDAPATPVVAASVILLAACSEDSRTYETADHGLFTRAVLDVWNEARFSGNLRAFHDAVRRRFDRATVLHTGARDPGFEESRPFTLTNVRPDFVPPLKVHLCWSPGESDPGCAEIATELYAALHRPVEDDPVLRPGLEIPVEYDRDLASLTEAVDLPEWHPRREPEVGTRLVVILLDRNGYDSTEFRNAVAAAIKRWPPPKGSTERAVLLPLVLYDRWKSALGNAGRTIPAIASAPQDDRRWRIAAEVGVVAGRALLRSLGGCKVRRPRVFISHAKSDGRTLAKALADKLKSGLHAPVDTFYDENDVDHGDDLVAQLEHAAGDGVVLVVRSDQYSESPWCGLELMAAKRERVPLVTLLHAKDGETTASTYGGNHRTMVWREGREWEVTCRCVQAWLHHHHFAAHAAAALAHAGLPSDAEIVARRPELIDLTRWTSTSGRRLLVYPDPPLAESEAAVLREAQPALRLVTPSTMLGRVLLTRDPSPPLAGCTLAFSLSNADDLPDLGRTREDSGLHLLPDALRRGLTRRHVDDVLQTIVLTTLQTGARIAYGGDLRCIELDGYAAKLSDLHRARRRLGTGDHSQLICYVGEHGREGNGDVEYFPQKVTALPGADAHPAQIRDALWQMAMRAKMTEQCDGRVVLGGQTRPAVVDDAPGYRGPWPGVLEEAWRTLDAGKALYLIGGLGGFAGVLARMLLDEELPSALTEVAHAGTRRAALASEVDDARAVLRAAGTSDSMLLCEDGLSLGMEEMARRILARWRSYIQGDSDAWNNGLSPEENVRLLRSSDRTEIAQLVFGGLRKRMTRSDDELAVTLYRGDIASAVDVDGYAVTHTPGLRRAGAFESLDRQMSGRLSQRLPGDGGEPVVAVSTGTDLLSGAEVLVARLDLPRDGTPIEQATLVALAKAVAQRADRSGLTSLAIVPFGATLGVPAPDAVRALIKGVRDGRDRFPHSLVICETDRTRYEAIRDMGEPFRELRAGPRARTATPTVVLQVDTTPDPDGKSIAVRTTAYAPDDGDAIVPRHEVSVSTERWTSLQTRPADSEEARARGHELASGLLSAGILQVLRQHAGQRMSLITSPLASSLPWELLSIFGEGQPIGVGVIRRIAMSVSTTSIRGLAARDPVLRMLLIADPRRDLPGAAAEGDAVRAVLASRRDVHVTALHGGDATVERVRRELDAEHQSYDLLHYAGHAYFDKVAPERSGLHLHGGTLTGRDLAEAKLPRLVVLGACESGRIRGGEGRAARVGEGTEVRPTVAPEALPLAEQFLRGGVTTLVGTFFPVGDSAARSFAETFYTALGGGQTVGDAVRAARVDLFQRHIADWGNFLLYGDDLLVP